VEINCGAGEAFDASATALARRRPRTRCSGFSQGSFIPHKIVRDEADAAPAEPVLIGLNRGPVGERWDLMINLAPEVPEFFSRYRRVAEVVDGDATRRALSRDRYRFYRDRGYTLNTHQV
jgi:DNA polymerase-3 subunit chi